MDNADVLVLTHPYEFFDRGYGIQEKISCEVRNDARDVIGVQASRGSRELGEPIGGSESYDDWIEDKEGYGRISQDDVRKISEKYEKIELGGYNFNQCVRRTKGSFSDMKVDVSVNREYAQETEIFNMI